MKIKITTNRQVWVNDAPRNRGDEIDVTDADAKALIDAQFAEAMEEAPARRRRAEIAE